MSHLNRIQKAVGWFALGLLLTMGLINLIGFISPFWGLWRHPEYVPGEFHSMDLLNFWQPIVCWFSLCFVVAAWHLAAAFRSRLARVAIILLGVLLAVARIVLFFVPENWTQAPPPSLTPLVYMGSSMIEWIALVAFPVILWIALRKQQSAAPQAGLANPAP